MAIFLSKGDFVSANENGVNFQRDNFPAAFWINLENFQNLFGNRWRSSENIRFSAKSSRKICVYLGFSLSPSPSHLYQLRYQELRRQKIFFLLLMEENLAEVMKGMSLGEDKSIIIPDEDEYCAMVRGGRSILGRLLNPDCQNMVRMLKTMPKIWKVYERVRGIALTKERFQFIFDLETDLQTVLRQGFWTFDDWGMAMERWVEHPPPNYLQTATIWVRLHNLPVNYFTTKTIDLVADGIGHVEMIEFDPEKPLLNDYVRVQVTLDLNQPIRDKKSITLPGGRVEYVDVEYERVRKKCFHCLRLSHEKLKCPLYQGSKNKGKGIAARPQGTHEGQSSGTRQHHNDLAERLMPLLAPSVPPGFEPLPTLVAPEVFEQMKIYMSCADPEERSIREAKMRKTLNELSKDPVAQRACLRLEMAPTITTEINRDRGKVFDFSRVQEQRSHEAAEFSSHGISSSARSANELNVGLKSKDYYQTSSQHKDCLLDAAKGVNESDTRRPEAGVFVMGSGNSPSKDRNSRSGNSQRSRSSWSRRNPKNRRLSQSGQTRNPVNEEGAGKRKACEEGEVSSKMSKQNGGLMVHQKPSNSQ